jgi:GT2 family glycosyltransferase
MIRRQLLDEVGCLDPQFFMFHEDVEWCLRFQRRGWRIYYYPFSRVLHLGGQSTKKIFSEMLVISQRSLYYLFQKHFGRSQVSILRLLTVVEMVLRSLGWGSFFIFSRTRRPECRERLRAYWTIFVKTLVDRSYWDPIGKNTTKKSS